MLDSKLKNELVTKISELRGIHEAIDMSLEARESFLWFEAYISLAIDSLEESLIVLNKDSSSIEKKEIA
jgi:hypothetical protein